MTSLWLVSRYNRTVARSSRMAGPIRSPPASTSSASRNPWTRAAKRSTVPGSMRRLTASPGVPSSSSRGSNAASVSAGLSAPSGLGSPRAYEAARSRSGRAVESACARSGSQPAGILSPRSQRLTSLRVSVGTPDRVHNRSASWRWLSRTSWRNRAMYTPKCFLRSSLTRWPPSWPLHRSIVAPPWPPSRPLRRIAALLKHGSERKPRQPRHRPRGMATGTTGADDVTGNTDVRPGTTPPECTRILHPCTRNRLVSGEPSGLSATYVECSR